MRLATLLLPTILLAHLCACSGPQVMVCEQSEHRLALMSADADWNQPDALIWQWQATDSAAIESAHRSWFNHPTDAKPVLGGDFVLTTASGGGVALIRLEDKATVFYAYAGGNPHSAELLPDGAIVTVSSSGNSLQLWRLDYRNSPIQKVEVADAHGVCWDPANELLWVIGGEQLHSFRYVGLEGIPPLQWTASHDLPGKGGHDLQRRALSDDLVLSTVDGVWLFHPQTLQFLPHPLISNWTDVKSISEAPQSAPAGSPTLLMQAKNFASADPSADAWWSDQVLSADHNWRRNWVGSKFYKARWWYERSSSKKFKPRLTIGVGFAGWLGVDPD